jgi:hypothetical protein
MTELSLADLQYCEQTADSTDDIFAISRQFARPEYRTELLIRKCLSQELVSIPFKVSDPEVCVTKISWWRQELGAERSLESQHPLVRSLVKTGVWSSLDPVQLDELISGVLQMALNFSNTSMTDIGQEALTTGGAMAMLECPLSMGSLREQQVREVGAASLVYRLCSSPYARICGDVWWAPYDLRARYALREGGGEDQNVHNAVRDMAGFALTQFESRFDETRSASEWSDAEVHHLGVFARVLFNRLRRLNGKGFIRGRVTYPVDVFSAWRQAIRK